MNHYPGTLRLVAIGPLTNIALACRTDSHLVAKLASFSVMGGDESGQPEFNFAQDARAASEVSTYHLQAAAVQRQLVGAVGM